MKTTEQTSILVSNLITKLNEKKLFDDQVIGYWKDESFHVSIDGNFFYDRICGNGRMPGYVTRIDITENGIIKNVTGDIRDVTFYLNEIFGREAVSAYIDRCHWYIEKSKKVGCNHPDQYRALIAEYEILIKSAEV